MITNSLDKIKYYTYCKECGEKAYIDASVVYTSIPPMYQYKCSKCGNVSYIFCNDANIEVGGGRDMEIKEVEFDSKSHIFDMDVKSKCEMPGFIGVVDNKIHQSQDRVYCTCEFGNMLIEFEAPNRESSVTKSTIKIR